MTLEMEKIEKISIETIKTLKSRFESLPNSNTTIRNMPFHKAFLKAFYNKIDIKNEEEAFKFLTLTSWYHGLNTTLGQSYFENISYILSDGEKRNFKEYKITEKAKYTISEIITDLKSGERKPNLEKENNLLKNALNDNNFTNGLKFVADVYIEEKDKIIMIELKSVRPNSGEMKGEKQKILYGKVYLMQENPEKEVYYYIAFPFDPTENPENPCGYNKKRFTDSLIEFSKFFDENEMLIASEYWDFISGDKNTMEQILNIINSIAKPDFEKKFEIINSFSFINQNELYTKNAIDDKKYNNYIQILKEWNLSSEIELAKLVANISMGSYELNKKDKKTFERLINNYMFKNNKYDADRKEKLLKLINR